jgi:hypothetical protein
MTGAIDMSRAPGPTEASTRPGRKEHIRPACERPTTDQDHPQKRIA